MLNTMVSIDITAEYLQVIADKYYPKANILFKSVPESNLITITINGTQVDAYDHDTLQNWADYMDERQTAKLVKFLTRNYFILEKYKSLYNKTTEYLKQYKCTVELVSYQPIDRQVQHVSNIHLKIDKDGRTYYFYDNNDRFDDTMIAHTRANEKTVGPYLRKHHTKQWVCCTSNNHKNSFFIHFSEWRSALRQLTR
jgi:hypothetical protein